MPFTYLLKGIGKNVILLGLVSLFTDLSSQIVFPLIPLYLTSLGAGAAIVGIIEGAAETMAAFLKVLSGYRSDKFKRRKPLVFLGYSISTFTKPLFALVSTWPLVLVVRVIERIGKGMRDAPRDALVADSTPAEYMGKAYGIQRTMDGLGSVLGAVLALVLFPILGYKNIFLLAFIPGLLALLVILFVKEGKELKRSQSIEKNVEKRLSLIEGIKILPRRLLLFIGVSGIFALGNFGYAFLLLKAKSVGASDHSAIIYYVLFYGIYTLFSIPAGILSDKIGRKTSLVIAYILFILVAASLMFITSSVGVIICFAVFGMLYAMYDGVQRALVVDFAGKENKGTALGLFHTMIGIVALPGGYILGLLWDKVSPSMAFGFSLVLGIIALIGLLLCNTSNGVKNK